MDEPHNIDPRGLENSHYSLLNEAYINSTPIIPIIHSSHGYHPFQQRTRVKQNSDNPSVNLENPTIEPLGIQSGRNIDHTELENSRYLLRPSANLENPTIEQSHRQSINTPI